MARAWGFPWWPARVISAVDGGKHRVLFFATRNTSDLDAPALAAWAAHPGWCSTKQKKKTLQKPFVAAVAEARAAVEKGGVVDEEAAAVEQAEAQLAAERAAAAAEAEYEARGATMDRAEAVKMLKRKAAAKGEEEKASPEQKTVAAGKPPPQGASLVGRRVTIFWDGDNRWFEAEVLQYDAATSNPKKYTVRYVADGVESAELSLAGYRKRWRLIAKEQKGGGREKMAAKREAVWRQLQRAIVSAGGDASQANGWTIRLVARRASHGNEDHYSRFLPPADLKGGQVRRSRTEVLRMLGLITGAGKPKKLKSGGGGGGSGGGSGGGTSGVKRERKKLDVWPGENAADEEPLRNVEPSRSRRTASSSASRCSPPTCASI